MSHFPGHHRSHGERSRSAFGQLGSAARSGTGPWLAVVVLVAGGAGCAPAQRAAQGGAAAGGTPVMADTVVPPTLASAEAPLVFRNVTVVDTREGRRLPERMVVIVGTRIQTIAAADEAEVPAGARIVDATGAFMIPGLWDMHVHPMAYVDIAYPLFVANGVTGIRDAGSDVPLATLGRWKQEVASGARVGPRVMVSGQSLRRSKGDRCNGRSHFICITTPAEVRLVVDLFHTLGADFIKTYWTSPELYFAMAAEARRLGMPFGGHLPEGKNGIDGRVASDSGATFLDHQTWFVPDICGQGYSWPGTNVDTAAINREACAEAAQRLRRNNTWVTVLAQGWLDSLRGQPKAAVQARGRARLVQYLPRSFSWNEREQAMAESPPSFREPSALTDWVPQGPAASSPLGRLHRAGIPLLVGTDAAIADNGWVIGFAQPGFWVHEALAGLVLSGMTPLEALQTATLNPALALRATDSLGTVEAGKVADLVLLEADPLVDVWNTTKIRGVAANGRYYDRTALDALFAATERRAAAYPAAADTTSEPTGP